MLHSPDVASSLTAAVLGYADSLASAQSVAIDFVQHHVKFNNTSQYHALNTPQHHALNTSQYHALNTPQHHALNTPQHHASCSQHITASCFMLSTHCSIMLLNSTPISTHISNIITTISHPGACGTPEGNEVVIKNQQQTYCPQLNNPSPEVKGTFNYKGVATIIHFIREQFQ